MRETLTPKERLERLQREVVDAQEVNLHTIVRPSKADYVWLLRVCAAAVEAHRAWIELDGIHDDYISLDKLFRAVEDLEGGAS